MKRLVLALSSVVVGMVVSSCAVGVRHPATYVTDSSATLNGRVLSIDGGPGSYFIEYGRTTARTNRTPTRSIDFIEDQIYPVSEPLAGLAASTLYHYAVCAEDESNAGEPYCSPDQTFTTGSPGGYSGVAFALDVVELNAQVDIYRVKADGTGPMRLTTDSDFDGYPSWSPDARRIAFDSFRDDNNEIYAMDADGGNQVNLTNNPAVDDLADWSPDGTKIAFTSTRDADFEIYLMDPDGSNPTRITTTAGTDWQATWSPDGTKLAFVSTRTGNNDIFIMNADGTNPVNITNHPSNDEHPDWSSDGRIAFTSSRTGPPRIYTMDADGSDVTPVTPVEGVPSLLDSQPSWSPDSSRIAYESQRCITDCQSSGSVVALFTIDPDGSDVLPLTAFDGEEDYAPAWSPRPEPEPAPTAR